MLTWITPSDNRFETMFDKRFPVQRALLLVVTKSKYELMVKIIPLYRMMKLILVILLFYDVKSNIGHKIEIMHIVKHMPYMAQQK